MFRGVIDAGKETNKKEKLKMGRRKRLGRKLWCPGIARNLRQEATVPHRGDIRGDILRRDDVMNLDKTRWERISKFSLKKILGPEGDQL